MLAGGIENMSQAPHVIRGLRARPAARPGQARGLLCTRRCSTRTAAVHGADGRELRRASTASRARSRTRTRCAASSSPRRRGPRAASPRRSCRSRSRRARASTVVDRDDHLRPDTTLEGLAKLPAAFSKDGTRHRRQRQRHRRRRRRADSGVGERPSKRHGLTPLGAAGRLGGGRRRSVATWAWARRRRRARRSSAPGLTLDDIDLIEVNEAFAGAVPRGREGARPRPRARSTSTAARSRSAIRSA